MIKNTEVRLGNLVMDKVTGQWMRVDEIGDNVGAYIINREEYPLPAGWEMCYIPLTPDIMTACGFKLECNGALILGVASDYGAILHYFNGVLVLLDGDSGAIGKPMHFLHQFQNLYFTLTGEELEVKL